MSDPKTIGRYAILHTLGKGAMGIVYLAEDTLLRRRVALKVITGDAITDERQARFLVEARAAAALAHPNIVVIHDLGEHDGLPYIAMELLEGDDLQAHVKARSRISTAEALELVLQVCDGLAYAHERKIVHRDIKPANLHVLPDGRVKIVDFGVAKVESTTTTKTGTVLGTPDYMAPEQIQGKAVDARVDIFATGVVLYELLTGIRPFTADSVATVVYNVLYKPQPTFAELGVSVAPEVERIVAKAMAKDPAARYQGMRDMAADIRRHLAGLGAERHASATGGDPAQPGPAQHAPTERLDSRVVAAALRKAPTPAGDAAPPPRTVARPGLLLRGRYELRNVIAGGGMGQVWSALDTELQEEVAIKVLHENVIQNKEDVDRFKREGKVARSLNHRNIIRTMNLEIDRDLHFIVMERLHGETLKEWMVGHPGTPAKMFVARVGEQLLLALEEAHDRGIVHRDLKPQNVFLEDTGSIPLVKVMDFGLAKSIRAANESHLTQSLYGTPAYMSPEHAAGAAVDRRSDIYSLGVVLHELAAGSLPIGGVADGCPEWARPVLARALAPRPADRWQTARDMREAWMAAATMDSTAPRAGEAASRRATDRSGDVPRPRPAARPAAGQATGPRPRPTPTPPARPSRAWIAWLGFLLVAAALAVVAAGRMGLVPPTMLSRLPAGVASILAPPSASTPPPAEPLVGASRKALDAAAAQGSWDAVNGWLEAWPEAPADERQEAGAKLREIEAAAESARAQATQAIMSASPDTDAALAGLAGATDSIGRGRRLRALPDWDDLDGAANVLRRVLEEEKARNPDGLELIAKDAPEPFRTRALESAKRLRSESKDVAELQRFLASAEAALDSLQAGAAETALANAERLLDPTDGAGAARLGELRSEVRELERFLAARKSADRAAVEKLAVNGRRPSLRNAAEKWLGSQPAAGAGEREPPQRPPVPPPPADNRVATLLRQARDAASRRPDPDLEALTSARDELKRLPSAPDVRQALEEVERLRAEAKDFLEFEAARSVNTIDAWITYLKSAERPTPEHDAQARKSLASLISSKVAGDIRRSRDLGKRVPPSRAESDQGLIDKGKTYAPGLADWDQLEADLAAAATAE